MSDMMAVFLNGIAQLEYDRNKPLPDHQAVYLEKMDARMAAGILVGEETIEHPDENQRARFVAANLLHAIKSNNESMAAALCSYLANRLPGLKQVRFDENEGDVAIELIFDQDYRKQVAVDFTSLH
jgi:hypothetical protein